MNGNAVQKQDFIKIKGEYEVISSRVEGPTSSGWDGWLTLETRRVTNEITDVEEVPNEAPEIKAGVPFMFVNENTSSDTVLSTYTAQDPNGDPLTYSLSGDDGALFNITDTGELSFIDPPDYESGKAFYSLSVNVSDDEFTDTKSVLVRIRDVIETTTMHAEGYSVSLTGGSENDLLYGGYGKDILEGGDGNDLIDGGPGKDTIVFGDGDTRLNLSPANDGVAQDTKHGSDTIMTSTIENITTGAGSDIIFANAADNIMDTGDGHDRLYGEAGDDMLIAGDGDDHLYGSYGKDNLAGGDGNDRLYGGYGNDILEGGSGDDILDGGLGKDTLVFGNGNTIVSLSDDKDGIAQDTGHGSDTIMTSSIENVTTGDGDDTIEGNVLDNILNGGAGNDTLTGGYGDDTLTGGSGEDTFVLDAVFGDDTITDFDGSSDMIDLSAIVGASVTTAATSDGDVKLTVEDSQGQQQGTLTLEDVSLEDWNAMDQENILLYTV